MGVFKKISICSCVVVLATLLLIPDALAQTAVYFRETSDVAANEDRTNDSLLIEWLKSEFGLDVVEFDDDNDPGQEMPASIDEFDIAFVSETTTSGNTVDMGYHFDSPTPMITGEQALQDDYAFQGGTGNGNNPGNSIEIINNTHPITQGLPLGEVQIYSADFEISELSVIPEGVTVLGIAPGDPTIARLWLVEAGATVNGFTTPGMRISNGLQAQEAFSSLTDAGMQIYRQLFAYALGLGGQSKVDHWEVLK